MEHALIVVEQGWGRGLLRGEGLKLPPLFSVELFHGGFDNATAPPNPFPQQCLTAGG